jgi:hypothetical protein
MSNSRIDCININKIGCDYYDENKYCPDNCIGFISNKEKIKNDVKIVNEEIIDQEIIAKKRSK